MSEKYASIKLLMK